MVVEPRYAPDFSIEIDGQPISMRLRSAIQGVVLQDGLEGADRVEIEIANENLQWLDHPLFRLDRKLTLSVGYQPDRLIRLFVGEIVGREASFPSNSAPTMTITAQDFLHRTTKGTRRRWFAIPVPMERHIPMPDLLTAGILSAENKLIPIFDPVGAALSIILGGVELIASAGDPEQSQKLIRKQPGENDFDFLSRVSVENGWEMMIDHSGVVGGYKLRFMSPLSHLSPDVTLRYGHSLIEFNPKITSVGQIAAVTASIWVSEIKTSFNVTVGWDWDRMSLTLDIRPVVNLIGMGASGLSSVSLELIDEPLTWASAPRALIGKLLPRLNKRLTGSGSTPGDPDITAGKVLRLEGLGVEFGGLYRVTGTRHSVDSNGYVTNFDVRKEIWFGSIPPVNQGAIPIRPLAPAIGR
jgi:uncharacterized protein